MLSLIESEIVNLQLIGILQKKGIDCSAYLNDFSDLIFDLAEISQKKRTEKLYEVYYSMVNQLIDPLPAKHEIKTRANEICNYLIRIR